MDRSVKIMFICKDKYVLFLDKSVKIICFSGVHIIPKIADFLDPKIIFCPQLKKHFQIPLTHLPPFAPNLKKVPLIKIKFQIPLTHLNPFAPNNKKNTPNYKKCPN